MVADLGERGERADRQPLLGLANAAQSGNIADVHQPGGLLDAVLHPVEEIDAARFNDGSVLQLRECRINRGAVSDGEAVHASSFPCAGARSAARTTSGVMGVRRTRTPVAL